MTTKNITHWIAGQAWTGTAERRGDVYDPATGAVTGQVDFASIGEVDQAVSVAVEAFAGWRNASVAKRTQVLFAFRELINSRRDELASIIVSEHGKVHSDALGEIARGIEVVEYACGIPQLSKGGFTEQASTGVDVYSIRQPLGPVAIISPFNFPAMVPMWFFPIAIAAGNTVVLKPSEKDPSAANFIAGLWKEAGLPDGVFNVVHGDKVSVDRLLEHPDIKAVSFVGSTPIARYVYETGTRYGKRVQALGGAKNHMLVLPDADLDLAADAAVNAGFGAAGERCMAISVLVAVDPVGDELVEKIKQRIAGLKVGPGCNGDSEMGPLVTGVHRDKVTSYLDAGLADGATLTVDGRKHPISGEGTANGFWLGPTIFDHVKPGMSVYDDEIFGPVLSVVRVTSYDEGLELINSSPYGNGTAIFTNDGGAARRFQYEVEVGMVGINVPIPVPVAYYSFGGWKNSLFGDTHAYGEDGVKFFTRGKAVTQRWLDPSHGGINLGFPTND
ncbi:CoA-acylating methylmalonate-semialdehyde dehydrogenase [Streptomyces sp. H10-C2]|uniref:CoA-acylating methylmalonate-semialdehyde dehydrogenase n=1 Tax=unclassified Streptomyces TaxID=2593676 RepID=UPI0024B9933C|nr:MULTISPECIES: CoA-acylating methylmalonate-semialdehyde dehydrogenase [unclassified Streptomyces]MDJ0343314.1 CoA-acylating methylmalonate-semialdehyde dehydrogenase [Streptomyces sp. PH10-H1]MDJ0372901.1 CoA-acylating methylmalonate-semialdehyde dehydrogenase [Streptomyces sp. H10-C2]